MELTRKRIETWLRQAERTDWGADMSTNDQVDVLRVAVRAFDAEEEIVRLKAERDEAIEDRKAARDDAARAAALLAVRTMERDARPAISREMARAWTADGIPYDEQVRAGGAIDAALRALAAGSGDGGDDA